VSRFSLEWETPVSWVERIAEEPLALLSDHARCEEQAAAAARMLAAKHPERERLVRELGEMELEETEHQERVTAVLHARGADVGPHRRSPYADGMLEGAKRGRRSDLLDRLLVCGLIESRSLERFRLLSRHLPDAELRELYRSLIASEAGHQVLFAELAIELAPSTEVERRTAELTALEAEVISGLEFDYRMHSGA
jgi:tRNA-(ms[2]io[6]A)-hydroxylase